MKRWLSPAKNKPRNENKPRTNPAAPPAQSTRRLHHGPGRPRCGARFPSDNNRSGLQGSGGNSSEEEKGTVPAFPGLPGAGHGGTSRLGREEEEDGVLHRGWEAGSSAGQAPASDAHPGVPGRRQSPAGVTGTLSANPHVLGLPPRRLAPASCPVATCKAARLHHGFPGPCAGQVSLPPLLVVGLRKQAFPTSG